MKIKVTMGITIIEATSMKELGEKMNVKSNQESKKEIKRRVLLLKERLEAHDWSYHYSDNMQTYSKGEKNAQSIKDLAKELKLTKFLSEWLKRNNRQL